MNRVAPTAPGCCPSLLMMLHDYRQAPVSFQSYRLNALLRPHSSRTHSRSQLSSRQPDPSHLVGLRDATFQYDRRFGLDEFLEVGPANRKEGHCELAQDQDHYRHHSLSHGYRRIHEHRTQDGTEGDGHYEIEGIELRESPFP